MCVNPIVSDFDSIAAANARWDAENAHRPKPPSGPWSGAVRGFPRASMRISNIVGEPLTDKKIARYERDGWYSPEFKAARLKMAARTKTLRKGNFIEDNGRLIYSIL